MDWRAGRAVFYYLRLEADKRGMPVYDRREDALAYIDQMRGNPDEHLALLDSAWENIGVLATALDREAFEPHPAIPAQLEEIARTNRIDFWLPGHRYGDPPQGVPISLGP